MNNAELREMVRLDEISNVRSVRIAVLEHAVAAPLARLVLAAGEKLSCPDGTDCGRECEKATCPLADIVRLATEEKSETAS